MSKNLKKVLIASASLLMMASVGAGLSSTKANASSGYYYIKRTFRRPGLSTVHKGTKLHGHPMTSTEDTKLVSFEYGPVYGFIPRKDVGYHHVYHHYYKHIKKHYRKHAKKHYNKHGKRHIRRHRHHRY